MMTLLFENIFCDFPENWQIGFQDPATPMLHAIRSFHNELWLPLFFISGLTFYMLYRTLQLYDEESNSIPSKVNHNQRLEMFWTIMPAVILFLIAIPSLALLYALEEIVEPSHTVKVIGHQWYWEYQYSDDVYYGKDGPGGNLIFNSYLLPAEDSRFPKGGLRLLEVDRRLVLPIKHNIRLIISSSDVLHSWAVPALGIKLDACPGRLNQTNLFINRTGLYYGQCSEICGVNHGFMPIVVEAVEPEQFKVFLLTLKAAEAE